MSIVGLIPARGGSKEVPQKNIKLLAGKPLIAHTIEAARSSCLLDRVIVSTDSDEIASITETYDAEVPFMRPKGIALDDTPDRPVMAHFIDWWMAAEGGDLELLVYLRPTTPLKTNDLIDRCIQKLKSDKRLSSVRTITRVEGVSHPYWMYKIENNRLKPFVGGLTKTKYYQRQTLPPCYRVNGVVDVLIPQNIIDSADIYGANTGYVEIDEHIGVDIDTAFDFEFCEFLMERYGNGIS
jgi:N-acylneuraminate cytidylyltransferase/CMP-N,N'-diacetyllegionaminic acid synthase